MLKGEKWNWEIKLERKKAGKEGRKKEIRRKLGNC